MPVAPTNGIWLDYLDEGPRGGPAIVLIMGLGGQRILWPRTLVDGLMANGLRVVSFDNRDVGRSTVLDTLSGDPDLIHAMLAGEDVAPPYRLEDMAADVIGLLDHLGLTRAHMVGASMGGMIAQHLGFGYAGRVASLTLINTTAGDWGSPAPPPDIPDDLRIAPPAQREAYVEWFVAGAQALSSPRWFDTAAVRELAREVHERGVHPKGTVRQLAALLADGSRVDRLREVTAPTLVLHGAEDPLIGVEAGRALHAAVAGSRLRVVEDMGHELALPLMPEITREIAGHVRAATDHGAASATPPWAVGLHRNPGRC